jgi:hypothetical protein
MSDTSISNSSEDLKATCALLRHQLNSVLVLLLVVSATSTIFFMRQAGEAGKQRDAIQRIVTEYNQTSEPALNEFTAKLREYARTHPDVVPILTKYGVLQVNNPAAPAAPAAVKR